MARLLCKLAAAARKMLHDKLEALVWPVARVKVQIACEKAAAWTISWKWRA